MQVEPRDSAPTELISREEPLSFRVWSRHLAYAEDPQPWKCLAAFRFLLECLDYIACCQDAGSDVVFQSPADTKLIKATDRRVVYKPESA